MGTTKAYVRIDEEDKDGHNIGFKKFFKLAEGAKTRIFTTAIPPNRDAPVVKVEAHAISRALEVIGIGTVYEDQLLEEVPNPIDDRDDPTQENIFELRGFVKIDRFAES